MPRSIRVGDDTEAVYLAMLADPAAQIVDLDERTGLSQTQVRDAVDALADLHLLEQHEETWRVVPPQRRYGQLVAEEEAGLLQKKADLAAAKAALARLSSEHLAKYERDTLIHLASGEAINERLSQLAASAVRECVSFNPGRRTPEAIEASKPLNRAALERGVGIRFVYSDSVRNDPISRDYGQWLSDLGGAARTVPVVPHLMIVVDRSVALLPSHPDQPSRGALEVRSPGVIAALMDHFEAVWSHGQALGHTHDRDVDGLTALERQLLGLLSDGHTDETSARRLSVSLRTVRRMMSDLTERLGARSRFEAGLLAERRGWLRASREST